MALPSAARGPRPAFPAELLAGVLLASALGLAGCFGIPITRAPLADEPVETIEETGSIDDPFPVPPAREPVRLGRTVKKGKFSIRIPRGFRVRRSAKAKLFCELVLRDEKYCPALTVIARPLELPPQVRGPLSLTDPVDVDLITAAVRSETREGLDEYRELTSGIVEVAGERALCIASSFFRENTPMRQLRYAFLRGRTVWLVTCSSPVSEWKELEPEFDAVAESFRFRGK